jgi:zinc transporter, ZIP family
MGAAVGWGALAASSLVVGVALAFARPWPPRWVGLVLAFGAGALISAVSFELFFEGTTAGGFGTTALGLAVGALTYYVLDGLIARRHASGRGLPGRVEASKPGPALALGAFLDGVPEQMALGIGVASGEGVSAGLVVAIFVSNLPEAVGSAVAMREAGTARHKIVRLWVAVAFTCIVAAVVGYAAADSTSGDFKAAIDGFAAGALIVMLVDSMIPEATREAGPTAGLMTALGYAVATALGAIS